MAELTTAEQIAALKAEIAGLEQARVTAATVKAYQIGEGSGARRVERASPADITALIDLRRADLARLETPALLRRRVFYAR